MRGKTLKSNVSVPCAYVEVRFESFNEADRLFHQPVNRIQSLRAKYKANPQSKGAVEIEMIISKLRLNSIE